MPCVFLLSSVHSPHLAWGTKLQRNSSHLCILGKTIRLLEQPVVEGQGNPGDKGGRTVGQMS